MSVPATLGCILAGGAGRRMGREKAGITLAGRPLVAHVVDRVAPQCAALVIAGPATSPPLVATGLPVVDDAIQGRLGPLAGVLTALRYAARTTPALAFVVTVPVDAPFLPSDLVGRLHGAIGDAAVCCAASGGRTHHATALWRAGLADDLAVALAEDGIRKVEAFVERHEAARASWPVAPVDPFTNLNTPDELARAEARLRGG